MRHVQSPHEKSLALLLKWCQNKTSVYFQRVGSTELPFEEGGGGGGGGGLAKVNGTSIL